jgi:ubiquinone/menaquinone biosynthesis C-methylase UbiE
MATPQEIRDQAKAQWGHDPAGGLVVDDDEIGTPESFESIERYRYQEQWWMADTFHWEEFRGKRVLEIGVGLGTDHLQLARAGAELTGIDLTRRCVDLTNRRLEQEGFRADVEEMDAERLAFPDDSFDAVYSFGVLHHIPSMEAAFREIRRVVRPGGVFVGGLYNRHSLFYARVRARRLLLAEWRHETLAERHARIEYSRSDAQPYVRLLGARELRKALNDAGFRDVKIVRRHAGLGPLRERVGHRVDDLLGRVGGWYLIHRAT